MRGASGGQLAGGAAVSDPAGQRLHLAALEPEPEPAALLRLRSRLADEPGYRRQIKAPANLQEGRHALARKIFHGRYGQLYQRYLDGMEDQLGALGYVLNSLVLFNTRCTDAALNKLRADGFEVLDQDVARLSPFTRHHIDMLGRHSFHLPELPGGCGRYTTQRLPKTSSPEITAGPTGSSSGAGARAGTRLRRLLHGEGHHADAHGHRARRARRASGIMQFGRELREPPSDVLPDPGIHPQLGVNGHALTSVHAPASAFSQCVRQGLGQQGGGLASVGQRRAVDSPVTTFPSAAAGALLGKLDQAGRVQASQVLAGECVRDVQFASEFCGGHGPGPHEVEHPQPQGMGEGAQRGVGLGHASQ